MARGPIDPAEFGSITVVVIMCLLQLAGCVAAWKEVITPSVRKSSVVLNVSFFTPALIFGKVAFDLTPEILASLWIVPVGFLVLSIVSAFVAWMVGFIFNLRKGYLILAIAASTFMNSNTLPIALMGTFSNSLKELKKTGKESPDYILSKSVTILAICASLGTVLRWSFGVYMLDHAKVETESKQSKNNNEEVTSFISVMNLSESKTHKTQAQKKSSYSERLDVEEIKVDEELPSTGLEYGAIAPPTALTTPLPFSAQEVLKAQEKPLNGQLSEKNSSKKYKVAWKSFLRGVADFFNPPLLSSILAIIVSCIPPLQKSLGSVKAIRGFLTMAGNVAIPLTLVNLGN
ncbi:auxin efflux carrier [Phakopsora pachyrhizi]|nr:auxin efflux carrier [Phakopsora pachyrhizi]